MYYLLSYLFGVLSGIMFIFIVALFKGIDKKTEDIKDIDTLSRSNIKKPI